MISRGELEQNMGTANAPAVKQSKVGSGIERRESDPPATPELVPPVKQAAAKSAPKFDWGQENKRD